MSRLVIELSVDKVNGKWVRKGLDMKGEECWEECEEVNEVYGDDWIDEVVNEVNRKEMKSV